ncbi:putative bifunctional diguanylate cyclase/phosphodiesterase [Thermocoleostomius sinensis]|uniref:EAL domain-containing protein n=1 Tax=Thermocoleostomius sinensis A174 TaxID=2016057 RepID=A0A9E8ZEL2_9CYAN|nr:GGDEF domain-containing phosphodiesterase [Thermocoleostomius sinensis]WAL61723.1 EAL domain-containing protein [Thermocoleostomius sinensis A174]
MLSTHSETLQQKFLEQSYRQLSASRWWQCFLPNVVATGIVLGFLLLGLCQRLEASLYQCLLMQPSIVPANWLNVSMVVLLLGLGLGGGLARLRFRYRFGTWVALGWGWLGFSLGLGGLGHPLPIFTLALLFGVNAVTVASAEWMRTYLSLRRSEERYALAAHGSHEGVWDWNLQTNRIYFSQRWRQMLGDPIATDRKSDHWVGGGQIGLVDSPELWFTRVHPLDLIPLKAAIAAHLNHKTDYFEQEYRLLHYDGTYRWMLARGLAVCNRDGRPERLVGTQTDITQRKQTEEELWRSAFFDKLTDLPNRTGFTKQVQQALERTHHQLESFAVLWVDIDCFELINNSFGGNVGDQLLISVSQRLRATLPSTDVVARMGGDEFAILLDQTQTVDEAIRVAKQLQEVLSLPFQIGVQEIFITVSIGIAFSSNQYRNPEHILRDADTAMHRAKAFGRSRYQVFDQTMRTRMVVRLLLENDLRRVVSSEPCERCQELQLLYQPIVQLETGALAGFEALVRWQHPEKGLLSPKKFISVAEDTGLIIPMSGWILRSACLQMRQWQLLFPDQFPLTMSVNLSSQQFSMPNLPKYIEQILQETDLNPVHLKLEITESMLMENAASIVSVLRQIRALGIQLAIDDFGTGYSSLSYLARFPINTLKIDRSFIHNIDLNSDSREIVKTVHALAHNLGMDVTAEGVETIDQVQHLQTMNCEYGQGYFFSPPLHTEAVTQLLRQQSCNRSSI